MYRREEEATPLKALSSSQHSSHNNYYTDSSSSSSGSDSSRSSSIEEVDDEGSGPLLPLSHVKEEKAKSAVPPMSEEDTKYYAQFSRAHRFRILILVGLPAILQPMLTTMYLPSLPFIRDELNTTDEMMALTISLYTATVGAMPLIWGPVTDRYGRRYIIFFSVIVFTISSFLCGLSNDIYYLIGMRVIQALGLSSSGVVGTASVTDVFPPAERGTGAGWLSITAMLGLIIGPLFGGIISQLMGWRYIFFLASAAGLCILVLIIFLLPETMKPGGKKRPINPLRPLSLLRFPTILMAASCVGVVSGSMYVMLIEFPLNVTEHFHYSEIDTGLAFLPFGIAALIGAQLGGRAADRGYRKFGTPGRVISSVTGMLGVFVSYLAFAYTISSSAVGMMIATGIAGFFLCFVRPGLTMFAIDTKPTEAGSVSANIFCFHSLSSFVMISIAPILINALSEQGIFIAMGVGVVLYAIPVSAVAMYYHLHPDVLQRMRESS